MNNEQQPASDTPEVDAVVPDMVRNGITGTRQLIAFARKLERERNKLVAQISEWRKLSDDGLRLRCGEMTAQEIRTVRAVLDALTHNDQAHA